jgi:hypothetical protein
VRLRRAAARTCVSSSRIRPRVEWRAEINVLKIG